MAVGAVSRSRAPELAIDQTNQFFNCAAEINNLCTLVLVEERKLIERGCHGAVPLDTNILTQRLLL
jgi:hypothetical protein